MVVFHSNDFQADDSYISQASQCMKELQSEAPLWLSLPHVDIDMIQARGKELNKKFDHLLVLGIGGSALGAEMIRDLFPSKTKTLQVLDNLDEASLERVFLSLHFNKTHVVVISKSGTTLETMSQFFLIRSFFEKQKGLTVNDHFTCITDEGPGVLRDIAEQEGISTVSIPKHIGGRFSVLTAVGLIPALFLGIDIDLLLSGAKVSSDIENMAIEWAACQKRKYDEGQTITTLFIYGDKYLKMGEWYRQLLSESLGKNGTGPTPLLARGSTDQHSLVQLLCDGPRDKWCLFFSEENTNISPLRLPKIMNPHFEYLSEKSVQEIFISLKNGTLESLQKSHVPCFEIKFSKLSPKELGAFILAAELQIAILGKIFQVNPYDQPAVEEGKKCTKRFIELSSVSSKE